MLINITFPFPLNVSIQATDVVYVTGTANGAAGLNVNQVNTSDQKPIPIGVVTNVNFATNTVTIQDSGAIFATIPGGALTLGQSSFVFFAKDRRANSSGVLGYYAEVEYRNYSKKPAEMFATATNFSESSK